MKINKIIELFKNNPEETLRSLDQENIEKIIKYLSDKYYNENISLVSDQLFDFVKEFYEKEYNIKYDKVGAPIKKNSSDKKIKLPYWMGSLDKIKPSTKTFEKWIKDYTGPYLISYKLDGISALLHKKNNKVSMYTRGDGTNGLDITHCIEHIGINITKLNEGDAIRGELIMSKNNFKKISEIMANARNAVSGIILTKKPDPSMLKLIDFVAYWVLNPEFKSSDQLKYIEKKEFIPKSVDYFIKEKITMNELSELLIDGRKNYKYEIDGIVVIDNSKIYPLENNSNPSYGFAFKQLLNDQIAESTVIDVIWEISKDKYIKPKIKINTIELLGSEITYATAFNAKFVVDNVIGPGSVVKIVKSGDVIPKIEEVLKPADTKKPKMPEIKYIWNDTKVDILIDGMNKEIMNKIIIKKLTYFFATLNIKWMAESTIEKLVLNGYDDLWKILSADKKKLQQIEGFGSILIDKLFTSIEDGLNNRELSEIMAASQIFGRGIGVKKFKLITSDFPNILDIYQKKGKDYTIKLINSINGFDSKTTNKIIDSMDNFIIYFEKFLKIKPNLLINLTNSIQNNNIKSSSNKNNTKLELYNGKTIVFTGFRDKEIENELEKIGCKISSSVSKNTNLVIAANPLENSNKINKARELNIKIISKDEFYKSIT